MAKIHADQEEYEAAIQAYERATRLKPDYCEAHANKALLQLLLGDLRHGWTEYEWRFRISDAAQPVDARTFDRPVWDGARFPGKTLLLRSEQGAGDMIQFCRYAPLVKERGGRVILECPPKLCRLLHDVPGVDAVVERRPVPSADFDLYIPLLSVPRLFSPSPGEIPAPVPYLAAEAELVRRTGALVRPGLLHVGLCWQGNPQYKGDARRSIPLAALLPVLQVPGVQCYSLQKGAGSEQMRSLPAGCAPIDLGGVLDNGEDAFCETAAVMQHLDLIISSDTAVPHLAGALGRPVWLLLAQTPEWRWFLQREDSPWYPTMRLFRQQTPGDWRTVVDRVVRELRHCGRPGEGGK